MNKPKRLRRRCAAEDCRKVFRHVDQRAAFCSLACKQRVYRARKKAAAQVEQEQNQAKLSAMAAAMMEQTAERERQALANRQPAPAPRTPAAPPPPAPEPWPYTHFQPLEPPAQTVIIRYRPPYMTPL